MDKQPHQDQGSVTPIRIVILIVVAFSVGGGFFSAVYLFDRWYARTTAVPEKKILVPLHSHGDDSLPSETPSSQSGKSADLTFFKNLTEQQTPYPEAPPVSTQPRKAPNPPPAPAHPPAPTPAPGTPAAAPSLPEPKSADVPPETKPAMPPETKPAALLPEIKPTQQTTPGRYTIQVGSFQTRSSAESIQKSLQEKGFSPYISPVRMNDGSTWYRVRVGYALPRSNADALAAKVQSQAKINPMVVADK